VDRFPRRTVGLVTALVAVLICGAAAAAVAPGSRHDSTTRDLTVRIGGFDVHVVGKTLNAWPTLRFYNASSLRPGPGLTDVMVTLRAVNRGSDGAIPFVSGTLEAIGKTNVYTPFAQSCGSIPNDYQNVNVVPPNHSVAVSVCWQVKKADGPALRMFYENYAGGERTFFGLDR
jgi:hypothetical protein